MSKTSIGFYEYESLPGHSGFRVVELLPGKGDDPISCKLHITEWSKIVPYEAISYAWGDVKIRRNITVHGKRLNVTESLHSGLTHLRYEDRSRYLWVDAICINQNDIPERGQQVSQMRRIYQSAQMVLIWLGPDGEEQHAKPAIEGIATIADFICQKVGIPKSELSSLENIYQQAIFKHRDVLPVPDEGPFSTEKVWKSLLWFFSHPYFTRVWAIQEINAHKAPLLHCGYEKVEWEQVNLVAGYIIMETAFSQKYGFSQAYCWWASTVTTELVQARNWLLMLYLASNFKATDSRDFLYGLFGLMEFEDGGDILKPDYGKPVQEVYRDSVETALINFKNTQVLLYLTGNETPSWVPDWEKEMLFRNPRRFGRELPWKPAGDTEPIWSINKKQNILSLSGFTVDTIGSVEPYNESYFGNAMINSDNGKDVLKKVWQKILKTMEYSGLQIPLAKTVLTAAGTSFSFGLDSGSYPTEPDGLFHNFVAYLKLCLDEDTFNNYISPEVIEECKDGDGQAFGKPVWDFEYPVSSFYITEGGLLGCCISETRKGDVVIIALGSLFPTVLRPDGDAFTIRGYTFVHGIMNGERKDSEVEVFNIK